MLFSGRQCSWDKIICNMRISQINAVYGFGSTGVIVEDLQQLCLRNNILCEVVYSITNKEASNTVRMGNLLSNKFHALMTRISGKQGYFSYCSTWKLLHHYEKFKPDIIHLHNLHSCYINVPMLLRYAAKKDIAVVVSLHDCWFYTGGCCHYASAGCNKWKEECGICPKRYSDVNALIFDGTKQMLTMRKRLFGKIRNLTAVGVSKWIVEEGKQSVFKDARCLAIHNGIDTDFFHPVNSDLRKKHNLEGKFVILAPANKWFLDINRETFDYFASHITDDMRMVFIGSGTDESRLTDRMINIGFVSSREEIREIFSACDVMVNCTREESLSLLNVEVQSCGTPVVTYSNTGVKETVDGKCGFAVENGNPEALWNAMMEIKRNGKGAYSALCREWAIKEFDRDINYYSYIELYKEIVAERK